MAGEANGTGTPEPRFLDSLFRRMAADAMPETLDNRDEEFMRQALAEAQAAFAENEVPVGCVVVSRDGRILGRGHNRRETLRDPTAHAEIIAITEAAAELRSWRLEGATVYATLEPCPMCAGALVMARVARLVFGARDPKAGAAGSVLDVLGCERLNHRVTVRSGVLADECGEILTEFFKRRRFENS